jgi:hypothetical protein
MVFAASGFREEGRIAVVTSVGSWMRWVRRVAA